MHRQVNDAVAEAAVADITSVVRHGRAHAGFDQLFDLRHDLGVGGIVADVLISLRGNRDPAGIAACEQRGLADEMVQKDRNDLRLQYRPVDSGGGGESGGGGNGGGGGGD